MPPDDLVWPLAVAMAVTAIVHLLLTGLYSNRDKAGILLTLAWLSFTFYSRLFTAVDDWRLRLALWVLILAAIAQWLRRSAGWSVRTTPLLNRISVCLLLIVLIGGVADTLRAQLATGDENDTTSAVAGSSLPRMTPAEWDLFRRARSADLPHIFYILLDAYGGRETLETLYGFDNREFYEALRARGFVIAERSRANFPHTSLAISSILNLDYPWNHLGEEHPRVGDVYASIRRPVLLRLLERMGYITAAYVNPTHATTIEPMIPLDSIYAGLPNRFSGLLLESTPVSDIFNHLTGTTLLGGGALERNLSLLRQAPRFARRKQPHFVYAHLMSPHNPFYFEADGSISPATHEFERWAQGFDRAELSDDDLVRLYRERYRAQVLGLNGRLLRMIDAIREGASRPTIIILQSDHGPRPQYITRADKNFTVDLLTDDAVYEWYPNLTAIAAPPDFKGLAYSGMTPVNTFRLLLARLLGEPMEPVPDRSYFPHDREGWRLDFIDVTGRSEDLHAAGRPGASTPPASSTQPE